jgi:hypothetical protein
MAVGRCPRRLGTIAIAALALGAAPPGALPEPGGEGWEPLHFRRIERTTDYTPLPGGGVRAEARCSASALVLPLSDLELERTPVLHWRWRVDRPLDIPDERRKSGDDFAARVYVMFRFQPEQASWLRRVQQRLGESLFGKEVPGTALNFVWASRETPGALWTSPYTEDTRLLALERGPSEAWRSEAVDVIAAYRRAFESSPPEPIALGIMTDSDDSCGHAVARYADFRFGPAGGAPAAIPEPRVRPHPAPGIPEGTP